MQRFYVHPKDILGDKITISGSEANHIAHSLRSKIGDKILVSPTKGENMADFDEYIDYICEITAFSKDTVTLKIGATFVSQTEPPYRARLFMAIPKGDKMDLIIQKSTELGVYEITPVLTERCVVKIDTRDHDKNEKKLVRWQKIAEGAASQCGRSIIPKINPPINFTDALEIAKKSDLSFICYEGDGTTPLSNILEKESKVQDISFFVGAEGGFSDKEVDFAKENSLLPIGLGKRILRCETAPLFVLSSISFVLDL